MKPSPIVNESWFRFYESAQKAGMVGSSVDWDECWMSFRPLAFDQQAAAIAGIEARAGTGDMVLMMLPQNYIRKKAWERPVRGKPKGKWDTECPL